MIGQWKADVETSGQRPPNADRKRKRVEALYALSRRSLWEMLLFLLVSMLALRCRDLDLFAAASEPLRQLLGTPPPAHLINAALAVYLFSALVILLVRMANGRRPQQRWSHLGYRSVFYLFYAFSGTLATHFAFVFGIGLLLYGLEQLNIWVYSGKSVEEEQELVNEQ